MSCHNHQAEEQYLPLDSTIKASSIPEYNTDNLTSSDSLYGEESQVGYLMGKISDLQKNYVEIERRYMKKIRDLRAQLTQKNKIQSTLNQQIGVLSEQYDQHKSKIQKISSEIKQIFKQTDQKEQKQPKIKLISPKNHCNTPKNHCNNSPKTLIKKSLQIFFKKSTQPNKQTQQSLQNCQQAHKKRNLDKSSNETIKSIEFYPKGKNRLTIQIGNQRNLDQNLVNSSQNLINSSYKVINGRKVIYSPSNVLKGPSPKKNILFNSSKELDLFSKPISQNKVTVLGNNPSPRRINIPPLQRRKQNLVFQNKITQKQLKKQLPVIDQRPLKVNKKQSNEQKINNYGSANPMSPSHNRQANSPQNIGFLRKKISSTFLLRKNGNNSHQQDKLSFQKLDEKMILENDKAYKDRLQTIRLQCKQKTAGKKKVQVDREKVQWNHKANKSPIQSNKNIKNHPETKFSPARKTIQNSPGPKKVGQVPNVQKPRFLGNMKQKIDENIFK